MTQIRCEHGVVNWGYCGQCNPLPTDNPPAPDRPSLREVLHTQALRIRQAYTEAHTKLGGSDAGVEAITKMEWQIIEEAENAIISTLADYLTGAAPKKKTLETDLPLDADEDETRFCVECGQWEFEGKLDCKCVGYNAAIDEYTANIKQLLGVERGRYQHEQA